MARSERQRGLMQADRKLSGPENENKVILAGAVAARRIESMRAVIGEAADGRVGAVGRIVPLCGNRSGELAHIHEETLGSRAGGRLVSECQGSVGGVSGGIIGGRADALEYGTILIGNQVVPGNRIDQVGEISHLPAAGGY